jgi:hypothetical protein
MKLEKFNDKTFREITFFMLCVTRIFKSNFEYLRLVTMN